MTHSSASVSLSHIGLERTVIDNLALGPELPGIKRIELRYRPIEIIGMIWMQGEADTSREDWANAYALNGGYLPVNLMTATRPNIPDGVTVRDARALDSYIRELALHDDEPDAIGPLVADLGPIRTPLLALAGEVGRLTPREREVAIAQHATIVWAALVISGGCGLHFGRRHGWRPILHAGAEQQGQQQQ